MLMQVGGEGFRPTFFEMAAAQHLPGSLRAALLYALGVMAQRRPFLHRVLDYSDEAFAGLMLLLESHSLQTSDGSFSEALYGLRRSPVDVTSTGLPSVESKREALPARLTRRHRLQCLLFLVGFPYVNSKLQAAYKRHRTAVLQAALWATGDAEILDREGSEFMSDVTTTQQFGQNASLLQRVRTKWNSLLAWCYPWILATGEGVSFAYQLLFLLNVIPYYSPALHVMRLVVRRTTGQELMEGNKHVVESRERELGRIQGPPLLQTLQRGFLRSVYGMLDYAQTGLIGTVFLFKMMEWWYQSAEQRVAAPTIYPPPPPPPAPKVAADGVGLPVDKRVCPLCTQKRTNPAMVAVSGFVFCYPCVFKYVSQYKRCPVTLVPAEVDQIRRLYYDT